MESRPNENHCLIQLDTKLLRSEQIAWASDYVKDIVMQRLPLHTERISIQVLSYDDEAAKGLLEAKQLEHPITPESFSLVRQSTEQMESIYIIGHDDRGTVLGLLELADLFICSSSEDEAWQQLALISSQTEKTAMPIRSITRLFVSEAEDKDWFYSHAFWDEYLTELAMQRFNRFQLALGIGYDSGHDPNVVDKYFCFAYPFLLQLPQYEVRADNLSADEIKGNLAMLKYISEQAKRRGLHFQLGLWTHAHSFLDSPNVRYPILGITSENHALYCRDALQALLEACPAIDGITLRVHYESGIPEPASEFWRIVMSGAQRDGQRIELDMHAKGVNEELIQTAVKSGSPVLLSAKYAAEHMGLPYHQADIRALEKPRTGKTELGFDALTAASRRFTRYGYGDFLQQDRPYDLIYRVWPGTQRLLLWGDPALAAGFGRLGRFGDAKGIEWFEPLSFKARKDSGSAGGREPYADADLQLGDSSWKKYRITYRLWGRLMYDPDSDPEVWRRYYRASFGEAALYFEQGLAAASRILPLITTASLPSAANNVYWPEMYTNQAIVEGQEPTDGDFDTPAPYTFGAVSPLDPQLFYTINDYVSDHLTGQLKGKVTPIEVAGLLRELAKEAQEQLASIAEYSAEKEEQRADWDRYFIDIEALSYIGQFFAYKIEAAVQYAYFQQLKDVSYVQQGLELYRAAKEIWKKLVDATAVYSDDITFGFKQHARGHWRDRLEGIDKDIAAMERLVKECLHSQEELSMNDEKLKPLHRNEWQEIIIEHNPPNINPGESAILQLTILGEREDITVEVYYRIAHQALSYESVEMTRNSDGYHASIPGAVTSSGYPLIYYFVIKQATGEAKLWPGFAATLSNQPYFVLPLNGREESR